MTILFLNWGILEYSYISFTKSWPWISAGWGLPANTNWTGLEGLFNSWVIFSISLNIKSALLYVANLLAKPIVRAFTSKLPTSLSISS